MSFTKYLVSVMASLGVLACGHNAGLKTHPSIDAAQAWVDAADRRDVEALETMLHPEFRVAFVTEGKAGASMMPKAVYLGLLRDGKIGGIPRIVKLLSAEVQDSIAFIRLHIESEKASFESSQTLVKENEQWRVVGESLLFSPRS